MPSDPITLVRWRDAKTDPPPHDEMAYLTHVKEEDFAYSAVCTYVGSEDIYGDIVGYAWYYGESGDPATPQPDLWADAPPPGDDPLTLDDLRALERMATYAVVETDFDGDGNPAMAGLRDRLRRALEEAEGT